MKKIGIICASDDELAPFLELLENVNIREKAMLKFYEGTINSISKNLKIVMLYCGVCKVNAAIGAQVLIDFYDVDIVINAGVCGSLNGQIGIFDTVISDRCVYHDVSKDVLTEFHPFMPSVYFEIDNNLLEIGRNAFFKDDTVYFGTMATGERFITGSNRFGIIKRYKPSSVDMETASIAHVCYVNKLPFIAIRTVTDTEEKPGVEEFEKNCINASHISMEKTCVFLTYLVQKTKEDEV